MIAHESHALFVYGTLADPEIQEALFGRRLSGVAATIPGWAVYCSESDGFLFIKPMTGWSVDGQVIRLTEREIEIADAWEDVPLYRRELVSVTSTQGSADVWAYTRREGQGSAHDPGSIGAHTREQVIGWAQELRSALGAD